MIDPNEPAYPFDKYTGLTIRQELAARFMAAELSATRAYSNNNYYGFARDAFRAADAFIRAENGEEKQ